MFFDFKKCKTTDKNTNILIQKPWCFKFVTTTGKMFFTQVLAAADYVHTTFTDQLELDRLCTNQLCCSR